MTEKTPEEELAEQLADKVEEAAHAQTARVEKRAEELAEHQAEQRIVQRVGERADQRADVQGELIGITEAIQTLIDHMDQSLPEERVQKVLDAALAEERRSRTRLLWTILSPIMVTIIVAGGAWWQSKANGEGIIASKKVAAYVENCLQHPDRLTPEERAEQCGREGNGAAALVKGLLASINCSLLIGPDDRTKANLDSCAEQSFGG
jgi:hypothetical protein